MNPTVRSSYLLPERGRLAKQKTGVSRRTLAPRWEHTFTYRGVALGDLASRALELSLWDRDRLASNDFMGGVRLSCGTGKYIISLLIFFFGPSGKIIRMTIPAHSGKRVRKTLSDFY